MDLLEHAAGVWAKRWLVLGAAVVIAASVFAARSAAPEQYVASTTVQVRLPDTEASDPSLQVGYYADTLVGLTTSRAVVDAALGAVGRDDALEDARGEISAEVGSEPGFVTLTAYGGSGQEAAELADALTDVLSEQVAAEQAADLAAQRAVVTDAITEVGRERPTVADDPFALAALERERESLLSSLRSLADQTSWRLAVIEPAVAPDSPTSPNPGRDALLAFLIALVLAGELVVVRRSWRGSLSARAPARDAGDAGGVPAFDLRREDGATALAPLLPVLGPARTVTVVQHGAAANARTAALLGELLAARGDGVLLLDAAPKRPTVHRELGVALSPGLTDLRASTLATSRGLDDVPRVRRLHVLAAGRPWLTGEQKDVAAVVASAAHQRVLVAVSVKRVDDLLSLAGDLDGVAVLDVDAATTTRDRVRTDVAALRGLGLDVVAVTVRRGTRRWWSGRPGQVVHAGGAGRPAEDESARAENVET